MITKEKIATIAFKIAMLLLLLLMLAFTFGCGSKKKTVEKEFAKVERTAVKTVSTSSQNDIRTTQQTAQKTETETETETENFTGEVADTSIPATVTVAKKNGQTVRTYYNFKNVTQGTQKATAKVTDTLGQNLSKTDLSKTNLTQKEQTTEKTESKTINKDLEVKRGFPWWILIIVLFLYAAVSYFGKSFNPLKWI